MKIQKLGDFIVIGVSIIALIVLFGYARPLIISPLDNLETTNNSVLFSFDKADTIFIDDNAEFTSPMELYAEDDLVVNLVPGTYYWKLRGATESKIHTLTIISEVDLRLRDVGSQYALVNAGNTELNVDIYNGSILQGNVILEHGEEKNASGTMFVGRENA